MKVKRRKTVALLKAEVIVREEIDENSTGSPFFFTHHAREQVDREVYINL